MQIIQTRVVELMDVVNSGVDCDLVEVNLAEFTIHLRQQVQFYPGKAVIKPESSQLMEQIACTRRCMDQTCEELHVPHMHWKVQQYT